MWAVKTKTGKYKYVERYTDPTGEKKYVSITLGGNRRQDKRYAEDFLRARIRDIESLKGKDSTLTLGMLSEAYYEAQKREVREQTAKANRHRVGTIVRLIGEDTMVKDLTAPLVRDRLWADSPTTYNERLNHYKALMRFGYRDELIADISHIDRLQKRKTDPTRLRVQDKYLEREELKDLLNAMQDPVWKLLTEFLALSGLRVGEAVALRRSDVNTFTREISVTRTYSYPLRKIVDSTKTDASMRGVYIQDELMDCVKRVQEFMKKFSSPYFFGMDDTYVSYKAYGRYFPKMTEEVVGRRLTPHALRHTHVALLAEAGVPLDAISRRLGHAHSAVTKDVYFHVTKKLQQTENEMLNHLKLL